MGTIEQTSWNDQGAQLRNDALRREKDEDLRDDDMIGSDRMADAGFVKVGRQDEDDETLVNDDVNGRDLDIENADEWDEDNVSDEDLDEDDLIDTDEANFEVHQIRNDKFGSLAPPINANNEPGPDEIPEEHESGNTVDYPDADRLEQSPDKEVIYKEQNEVEQPRENEGGEPAPATLNNLDPSFTGNNHGRTTGRMIDHEPGTPNNL